MTKNPFAKCEKSYIKNVLCAGSLDMSVSDSQHISLYYKTKHELCKCSSLYRRYHSQLYLSAAGKQVSQQFHEKDLPKPVRCQYSTASQVLIATSIAPKGIEKQRVAIDSWIVQGFSVVSINYPEEIRILEKDFPDVQFVTTTLDSFPELGKKRVYVNDVLDTLSACIDNYSVFGIVNSDIALYQLDADKLTRIGSRELIISNRIDVPSNEVYFFGVDAFFFSSALFSEDKEELSRYLLGEPWWDFAFPWFCMKRGFVVSRACPPLCTHREHEAVWSPENWWALGRVFYRSAVKELELYWNVSSVCEKQQVNLYAWFFLFVTLLYREAKPVNLLHDENNVKTESCDRPSSLPWFVRWARLLIRPTTLEKVLAEVECTGSSFPEPLCAVFNPTMLYYVDASGWHESEAWGTWASAKKSFFSFRITPRRYRLELCVRFFIESGCLNALRICINGRVLYTGEAINSTVSLDITPELFVEDMLRVELVTDEPLQSPSCVGKSLDNRLFAMGISTISLKTVDQ